MDAIKKIKNNSLLRVKLFALLSEKKKLLIANNNKWLQKQLNVDLFDYKYFGNYPYYK